MTIVLQHQFWDLAVADDSFEVGLSFGGIPERVAVPLAAVTAFFDPAVQFGFQFESVDAVPDNTETETQTTEESLEASARLPAAVPAQTAEAGNVGGAGGEVVSLDRFRKK
jgi:hypothetical protein